MGSTTQSEGGDDAQHADGGPPPPEPPPQHRWRGRSAATAARWFWFVHINGAVVLPHDDPPAVFGGSDYRMVFDGETGRTLYQHRWLPVDVAPPTDDPEVMAGCCADAPNWVRPLLRHWERVVDALEEEALRTLEQQEQRKALEARGLDPATGTSAWQPFLV
jgi:hypothetical protein